MPLSSPQKITPFAALAYRTMAGYYRRSQPRVLLIGAPHRLLRGEALARQVFAHRAHRKESPTALPDDLAHRRPAPEREV